MAWVRRSLSFLMIAGLCCPRRHADRAVTCDGMAVRVLDHPLAGELLAVLREASTTPSAFRSASQTLAAMLALESTRGLRTRAATVTTPLEVAPAERLDQGLAIIPILRAGLGLLQPFIDLFPDVAIGYIGLERDEATAVARIYYSKLPCLNGRFVILLDPMLATGGSASHAIRLAKESGAEQVTLTCVVAAPQGIARVEADHPDVPIVTASIDRDLNALKYILPGLGDYGDRLFGTP